MPAQANLLVERMKSEPGVDFENDWKLITLFIGGNDLCDYCDDKVRGHAHEFALINNNYSNYSDKNHLNHYYINYKLLRYMILNILSLCTGDL